MDTGICRETETLETKVVSHGVEGVNVDPNGEGRHGGSGDSSRGKRRTVEDFGK